MRKTSLVVFIFLLVSVSSAFALEGYVTYDRHHTHICYYGNGQTHRIDYVNGQQGFHCVTQNISSSEIIIQCDSRSDGNGDGYCSSGETCLAFGFYENYLFPSALDPSYVTVSHENGNNCLLPPQISLINPLNNTIYTMSDQNITLNIETEHVSDCRYSTVADQAFSDMATFDRAGYFSKNFSTTLMTSLINKKTYDYYFKCKNPFADINTNSVLTFSANWDESPPNITSTNPPHNFVYIISSPTTNISIMTDVIAECRYSTTANVTFDSMSLFNVTNSTVHSFLTDIVNEGNYTYYIKCNNLENEISPEFDLSLSAQLAQCSDGTFYNECSSTKNFYCNDHGNLIYLFPSCGNNIIQITTDLGNQTAPQIYGHKIVYNDTRNGNTDIYLYDLATKTETQLTNDSDEQYNPLIYGNNVIWFEDKDSEIYSRLNANLSIYHYDLSTGVKRKIANLTVGGNLLQVINADIYENNVVWTDGNGAYLYDLTNNTQKFLGSGNQPDSTVIAIYDNTVIWRSGTFSTIVYDILQNTFYEAFAFGIEIYGEKMIYRGDRFFEVVDLPTNQTKELGNQYAYNAKIYGDKVVLGSTAHDINLYDLSNDQFTTLVGGSSRQATPSIDGNIVVWSDDRNGNWDIYMINLGTIPNISGFDGITTDLSMLDLSSIENFTLEDVNDGKIIFSKAVNLTGIENFSDYITISPNLISINSAALPALNKSAILYLYNLSYQNPQIVKDGEVCPAEICQILSYNNGTLIFTVTQFSTYTSEEAPIPPPSSSSGGSSGGGGGGGGSRGSSSSSSKTTGTNTSTTIKAEEPIVEEVNKTVEELPQKSLLFSNPFDALKEKLLKEPKQKLFLNGGIIVAIIVVIILGLKWYRKKK